MVSIRVLFPRPLPGEGEGEGPKLTHEPSSLPSPRKTVSRLPDVILSASEESLFSDAYEEGSFGYRLRMTL